MTLLLFHVKKHIETAYIPGIVFFFLNITCIPNKWFYFFPFFSLYTFFLEKNIIFLCFTLWPIFTIFYYSFVICFFNIFSLHFLFLEIYSTQTEEMVFQCSNCNIVLFFGYVKNSFKILHIFISVYDLYYILLYVSVDFVIHGYFFTWCKRTR